MIRFACGCGRQLQAREEDIGRQAECPVCGARSVVPGGDGPALQPEDGIHSDLPNRPSREDRSEERTDRPKRRRERDPVPTGTSGKAIAALILGISSLVLLIPAIPGAIFGILALRDIGRSDGGLGGKGMAIAGLVISCLCFLMVLPVALLLPAVQKVRSAAGRMKDANNLRQMAIGMQGLHDETGAFPQAAAYQDANGRPLLSWRVAILPYIEQENLYRQFRLDEPWDSPNNKALLPLMPKEYAIPGDTNTGSGMTHYQVFVGPGSAFEPLKGNQGFPGGLRNGWGLSSFPDGTSNTILIATSATPVPWTKPDDMPFDPQGPLPKLAGYVSGGSNVVFADGSIRFIPQGTNDATMRALITRNGNESVTLP